MVNFLLFPVGSAGDIHPYVGLGKALKARGHRVTVITNSYYRELIEKVGLDFVGLGNREEFDHVLNSPDLWHPTKGPKMVMQQVVLKQMRDMYRMLEERYIPGETVAAGPALAVGLRAAQDKLGVPLVTVHLQPCLLRSNLQPPKLPGLWVPPWTPPSLMSFLYWIVDVVGLNPMLKTEVNRFRRDLGLKPISRIGQYWESPQRIVGLFPEWFSPRQPDWPAQAVLTGFPRFDEREAHVISPEAEAFLQDGEPPFVFTFGTAMMHAQAAFEQAVEACRILGRKGVLLSRCDTQIPANLPPFMRHFEYLPLSWILPRSAALIFHGGVGTLAQAAACGIPQLIMPMSHDQPDNGRRVQRLGIGDVLFPREFKGPAIAAKLKSLSNSAAVAANCRQVASYFEDDRAVEQTCEVFEQMVRPQHAYRQIHATAPFGRPHAASLAALPAKRA